MDNQESDKNELYVCTECGLHYETEQIALDCYDFCTKNNACSVEITTYSIEAKTKL